MLWVRLGCGSSGLLHSVVAVFHEFLDGDGVKSGTDFVVVTNRTPAGLGGARLRALRVSLISPCMCISVTYNQAETPGLYQTVCNTLITAMAP